MIDTDLLKSKAYGFIQSDKHLGRHVILLGLAGSYSYGTNNEKSIVNQLLPERVQVQIMLRIQNTASSSPTSTWAGM